jgi:NAD(P)-dependent dehydrogenase (short-subunit alcohol dehydrogenase family)
MSARNSSHEPLTPASVDVLSRFRLDGKVAIVTGGTRGIGLSIACTFARAGAKVMVSSRKADHVEAAVQALRADGHDVHGLAANMGQPSEAHELAARTVEQFDGIDIIVNNAATNPIFGPLQQATSEAFDKIFDVNVKGPFELCKTAHAVMVERGGGAIVNVSSIGGITPEAGLGFYSMSKSALISLTKVMAQEWGAEGIRANAICPGLIRTKFSAALWQDDAIADKVLGHQPLRRIGVPDDVAGLALFLASDASAYCTGAVYMVDGGYLS